MKTKNSVLLKKKMLKLSIGFMLSFIVLILLAGFISGSVSAESPSIKIDLSSGAADSGSSTLDLLFLLAFIALIPTFLMMLTCFTRLVISFSFLRMAMGVANYSNDCRCLLLTFLVKKFEWISSYFHIHNVSGFFTDKNGSI